MALGRSGAWILAKTLETWLRTVFGLSTSRRAIVRLSRPSATSREDVELTVGQLRERAGGGGAADLDQLGDGLGQSWSSTTSPAATARSGVLDPLGPGALHEVAAGAVAQRGEHACRGPPTSSA